MLEYSREQFMDAFVEETRPLAERVGRLFLQLEQMAQQGMNPEAIWPELRSDLHTIKGNAAMMEKDVLRDLAHDLEDLVLLLSGSGRGIEGELADRVLRATDLLVELVPLLEVEEALEEESRNLGQILQHLASKACIQNIYVAKSKTPAVDMSQELPQDLRVSIGAVEAMEGQLAGILEEMDSPAAWANRGDLKARLETLQAMLLEAKQIPLKMLFERYHRPVRDLARSQGKSVQMELSGSDIRINRNHAQALGEALVHLLRNAVDHGLELPQERRALEKDPVGKLSLEARLDAGYLIIEVVDDGRGLDMEAIKTRAASLGLKVEGLSRSQLERYIFTSGFSTREQVSEVSGRGVGLDVVAKRIEDLGGRLEVLSTPGEGTLFRFTLPR